MTDPVTAPDLWGQEEFLTERPDREATVVRLNRAQARRLEFSLPGELRAKVRAAGPRRWLIKTVWIQGTPMVIGAEAKLGKTMAIADLAISIASGTAWMNALDVEQTGPVVIFLAEDDEPEILRRMDAICAARGIDFDDELEIHLCFSAPNLSSAQSLAEVEAKLAEVRPVAAILDPLYLAIGERGDGSNLYAMGDVLNAYKAICRAHQVAPCVVTHWNKGGTGTGASRFSGTGTQQWARTLMSGSVEDLSVQEVPTVLDDGREVMQRRATSTIKWEVSGNSVVPQHIVVRRRMWAEDPEDLNCPLHYEIERIDPVVGSRSTSKPAKLTASDRVLASLERHGGWMSKDDVQEEDGQNRPVLRDGTLALHLPRDTAYRALCKHVGKGVKQAEVGGLAVFALDRVEADPASYVPLKPF